MRVLITGGGGFIGAWIIRRLLAAQDTVRVFDAKSDRGIVREIVGAQADTFDWIVGDVSDRAALTRAAEGCDIIFHMAAILTPACAAAPIRGAEIVLIGTLNAFEAARAHKMRQIIYMSSAGVFGPDDGENPRPTTHYGAFKLACEGSARAYWLDHGIASVGFRPLVVYGPGRETGLTAGPTLACRAAAENRPYTIPFTGPSDFLFVDDIAAAFTIAATSDLKGAGAYNLVGVKATAEEFAAQIMKRAPSNRITAEGPALPVSGAIVPGNVRELFPAIPATSLGDGITRTIDHYRRRI